MHIKRNWIWTKWISFSLKVEGKHFYLFVFCLLLVAESLYAQQVEWELLNPRPTSSNLNIVEFVNTEVGFVSTDGATYMTEDGGETWAEREELPGCDGLAFWENHGFFIAQNGSQNSIYESTDGGMTWLELDIEVQGYLRKVQFIDADNVVITSTTGLLVTANGGDFWAEVPHSIPNLVDSYFHAGGFGVVVTSNGFIYSTEDYAQNWTIRYEVESSWNTFLAVEFITPLVGFASLDGLSIETVKTTDGGLTWDDVGDDIDWVMDCIHFVDETTGFMAGEYGRIYRTTDGGESWEEITNGDYGLNDAYNIKAIYGFDSMNLLAVGRGGRISRTYDGGDSWSFNSNIFTQIRDIAFVNESIAYLITANEMYNSTDGGFNWNKVCDEPSGQYGSATQIIFTSEEVGFLTSYGSSFAFYYRTQNGGESWIELTDPNPFLDYVNFMGFYHPDTIITSTSDNTYNYPSSADATYRVTNNGQEWTEVYDNTINDISFVSAQVFYGLEYYVGTRRILKTDDGGDSWQTIFQTEDTILLALDFPTEQVGYCTVDAHGFYKTMDGGENWDYIDFDFQNNGDYQREIHFVDADNGYIQDEDGRIHETQDGGENWNSIGGVYGAHVMKAFGTYLYAAGDEGHLIRRQFSSVLGSKQLESPHNEFEVFPNPAKGFFTIQMAKTNQTTTFEIYDVNGRNVKQVHSQFSETLLIDLSYCAPGVYIIRQLKDSGVATRKLILE